MTSTEQLNKLQIVLINYIFLITINRLNSKSFKFYFYCGDTQCFGKLKFIFQKATPHSSEQ